MIIFLLIFLIQFLLFNCYGTISRHIFGLLWKWFSGFGIFWQECEDNSYIRQIAKSVGRWSASVSINPPVNPKFLRLKRSSPNSANQCSRTTWFQICHCTMQLRHSSFSSSIFDVSMSECLIVNNQHFIWCKYTRRSLQEGRLIVKLFAIS